MGRELHPYVYEYGTSYDYGVPFRPPVGISSDPPLGPRENAKRNDGKFSNEFPPVLPRLLIYSQGVSNHEQFFLCLLMVSFSLAFALWVFWRVFRQLFLPLGVPGWALVFFYGDLPRPVQRAGVNGVLNAVPFMMRCMWAPVFIWSTYLRSRCLSDDFGVLGFCGCFGECFRVSLDEVPAVLVCVCVCVFFFPRNLRPDWVKPARDGAGVRGLAEGMGRELHPYVYVRPSAASLAHDTGIWV